MSIIEDFVLQEAESSVTIKDKKSHQTELVNRSIFDIESYLVSLRQRFNVNQRLDTSIVSANILENFNDTSAIKAFKPVDFQFNLLHHLALWFSEGKDLFALIDEFVDQHKHQFSIADIVITKTGVTRCKTNLRFALNQLRDLGLVLSKDSHQRRTWAPSTAGLAVMVNIMLFQEEFAHNPCFKTPGKIFIRGGKQIPTKYAYDPVLIDSIRQFKSGEHLYRFLSHLTSHSTDSHKKTLEKLTNVYIDFINDTLEISADGIKMTKEFKEKSAIFQQQILGFELSADHFRNHLLDYIINNGKSAKSA